MSNKKNAKSLKLTAMENIAPPEVIIMPGDPKKASKTSSLKLKKELLTLVPSLSIVAANYKDSCKGGDKYENNCAHYLSNAFINAGYQELLNNPNIIARCNTNAKRPVRAREMWNWFKTKATRSSRTIKRGTGWWATFQLKENVYWGGHVVLFDSNAWKYYGTGWYGQWDQYLYQW